MRRITSVWVVCVVMLVFTGILGATAQEPDVLFYKGKKHGILTNPLEDLFKSNPQIKERLDDARFNRVEYVGSSANWRGYVAMWKINKRKLYLTGLELVDEHSVFKEVFPGQNKVFAEWYTGLIILPEGEMTNYVHMGYGSAFERYLVIRIKKGVVLKEKSFSGPEYQKFKKRQFDAYQKTAEYGRRVSSLRKKGHNQEFIDRFLSVYLIQYTAKMLIDEI